MLERDIRQNKIKQDKTSLMQYTEEVDNSLPYSWYRYHLKIPLFLEGVTLNLFDTTFKPIFKFNFGIWNKL